MTKEKKVKRIDINPISLMAALISLCALFVSIYQMQLNKKEQMASVWPHVRIFFQTETNDSTFTWHLNVRNQGVGPAIIQSVKYEIKDEELPNLEALLKIITEATPTEMDGSSTDMVNTGEFVPAGESITVVSTKRPKKDMDAFLKRIEGIRVTVNYDSVYGENWESCAGCPDNSKNRKGQIKE